MCMWFQVLAVTVAIAPRIALAVDVDEQTRRCNMEKNAMNNPLHHEGGECLRLRAMLNLPEPPKIEINQLNTTPSPSSGAQRVYDPQRATWCWVYPNGTTQCN